MACVHPIRLARSAAVALVAAVGLVAAAPTWSVPAGAATAVRFTLDRAIDGPAAPFFLAIDNGYFKDEGLDVAIDAASGATLEPIKRLMSGGYDMGIADLNALIRFRDISNSPIKAAFIVFDRPASAIIARRSRGIAAPRDLQGKKVGAPLAASDSAQWPIFAKVNGIDARKVTVETIGAPVSEPMLAAGEVDAIVGHSFTSYVDLTNRGVPSDDLLVLLMADYGIELYGDAIIVAPAFAAGKPDAVAGFLRAYVKALKDTLRDPDRAVEAVLRRNGAAQKRVELERLRMAIRDNILTPAVKASGFGGIDPARFAAAIDQLALGYAFKAKNKAADAFDPSFLPAATERKVSESVAH